MERKRRQRRAGLRFEHFRDPERPPRGDLPGELRRRRDARRLSGLLTQCGGRRRRRSYPERRRLWQRNRLELPDPAHARQRQRFLLPDRLLDVAIGGLQRHLQHGRRRAVPARRHGRPPLPPSDQGWVGGTEVSATWVADAGNATNATYSIYDGTATTGTLLGTVTVDQTQGARRHQLTAARSSRNWAIYYPPSGTLTVVLEREFRQRHRGRRRHRHRPGLGHRRRSEPVRVGALVPARGPEHRIPDDSRRVLRRQRQQRGDLFTRTADCGYDYFGTSLSSPCWAGLIAIANQGRVADGGTTFNSTADPMQTLQALYSLPASDFNDITSGYNGSQCRGRLRRGHRPGLADRQSPGPRPGRHTIYRPPTGDHRPAAVDGHRRAGFTLTVKVEDSIGDVITGYNGTVTITLANNPGSGTLGGTMTVTIVNGVAVFSGLTLNKVGTGYTLTVTSGSLTTTTIGFNVAAAAASSFTFSGMPATAAAGTAFNFTVTAYDAYGNVATGYMGTIDFTSSDPSAILPANYPFTLANAGTHTFSATLKTGGTQTITATDSVTSTITGKGSTIVSTATFLEQTRRPRGAGSAPTAQGYDIVSGPSSLPGQRHRHAQRPVDLYLDDHLHRSPRLAGPRLVEPRRRRLVLRHQLHRQRQPRPTARPTTWSCTSTTGTTRGAASRCRSAMPRRGRCWPPRRSRRSRTACTWTGRSRATW